MTFAHFIGLYLGKWQRDSTVAPNRQCSSYIIHPVVLQEANGCLTSSGLAECLQYLGKVTVCRLPYVTSAHV